jgi:hypothetical protein
MPNLEVEVMLKDHPHLFIVEIDSVLDSPKVGSAMKCKTCGYQGVIARVGTPSRKPREPHTYGDNQTSIFKED